MAKRIALFCHKGGVGKTTTTFNLAWMLADKGKKVLMVDADSQCNLTALVMGEEQFELFYQEANPQNIKNALLPAFKGRATLIQPVECFEIIDNKNLFLLPGHLGLSEYETTLSFAQTSPDAIFTLQNIPGAFSYLCTETAKKYDVDYILVDMSPSLSAINQNLLMTSDYFIIPTSPDYFSIMAIDSMSEVLPRWATWASKFMSMEALTEEALYSLPIIKPKFLGAVVQRLGRRYGETTNQFQLAIDNIGQCIIEHLLPDLRKKELCFAPERYDDILGGNNIFLAKIPEFGQLNSLSQKNNKAIFALLDTEMTFNNEETGREIPYTGSILKNINKKKEDLKNIFSEFANFVIQLTKI